MAQDAYAEDINKRAVAATAFGLFDTGLGA